VTVPGGGGNASGNGEAWGFMMAGEEAQEAFCPVVEVTQG
jgi:hypothetical protein